MTACIEEDTATGPSRFIGSRTVMAVLVAGLAVRLVLIPFTSSPFDVSAGWVAVIEEIYAGDSLYDADLYKYTPVWGYILAVAAGAADLLGMSSFGSPFTDIYLERELTFGYCYITDPGFNILIKTPALVFDVLTAFSAYRLVRDISGDDRKAEIGFAMWFLCPVVILSSAVLCMFDSIMIFFMIESIIALRHRRYGLAGALLAVSILTKAFPAVILPLMAVYVLSERGTPPPPRGQRIWRRRSWGSQRCCSSCTGPSSPTESWRTACGSSRAAGTATPTSDSTGTTYRSTTYSSGCRRSRPSCWDRARSWPCAGRTARGRSSRWSSSRCPSCSASRTCPTRPRTGSSWSRRC